MNRGAIRTDQDKSDNTMDLYVSVVLGLTTGCNPQVEPKQNTAALESKSTSAQNLQRYQVQPIADFNEPWALAELPDGRLLITEKAGKLKLFDPKTGQSLDVQAIPEVTVAKPQVVSGDVILDPDFKQNQQIYLSYAKRVRLVTVQS